MKKLKPKFIPFDIVKTRKGSYAIINEMNNCQNKYFQYSVMFIENIDNDKNAWHQESELKYINNLNYIFMHAFEHPLKNEENCYSKKILKEMRNIKVSKNKNYD